MFTAIFFFILGVIAAPVVTPLLRPALTELIKLFLILSQKVAVVAEEVKEDLEDVTAEARAGAAQAEAAGTASDAAPEDNGPPPN